MKNKHSALAMMALAMAAMGSDVPHSMRERATPADLAAIEQERKRRIEELNEERGVREWTIDGITVWARNEKNAIRKVKNIKNGLG